MWNYWFVNLFVFQTKEHTYACARCTSARFLYLCLGLRIAYAPTLGGCGTVDPQTLKLANQAAEVFKALGAEVIHCEPAVSEKDLGFSPHQVRFLLIFFSLPVRYPLTKVHYIKLTAFFVQQLMDATMLRAILFVSHLTASRLQGSGPKPKRSRDFGRARYRYKGSFLIQSISAPHPTDMVYGWHFRSSWQVFVTLYY